MTGRKKTTDSSKPKLPEVPAIVFDKKTGKQYRKGDFLGKVSVVNLMGFSALDQQVPRPPFLSWVDSTINLNCIN